MTPAISEKPAAFRAFTTTLAVLSVCLFIAAGLLVVLAILFSLTSYVFNDSGHVPEAVAPLVHVMFLDALIALVLAIWQLRVRKHLAAMLPGARKSMLALGIAYIVAAAINAWQIWILSVPLAAIGIWWIVVFSRSNTRAAFENTQPAPEILPPGN